MGFQINREVDYRSSIHLPIETALAQYDEVISLLATLGAEVEIPIKGTKAIHLRQPLSLLQCISEAMSSLASKTAPEPIPGNFPDSPAGDSWSQYRAYLSTVLPHCKFEEIGYASSLLLSPLSTDTLPTPDEGHDSAEKHYLAFAESVLRAHGATLPDGTSTSATAGMGTWTPITSMESGYMGETNVPVLLHMKVFYDELFEACWNGDNASIRELCLPKQVAEGKEPIPIAVRTTSSGVRMHEPSYGVLLVRAVLKVRLSDFFFRRLDAIPCRSASPSLGNCTTRP